MRETNKSHLDGAEAGEPELHSLPKPAAVQPRHPALTSVAAWACVRARARMAAINLGPIHCTLLRAMALYLHGSLRHACGGKGFGEPSRGSSGRSGEEGRLFLAIHGGWNVRTKIVRETILTTFRENWEKYHLCGLNSDLAETS